MGSLSDYYENAILDYVAGGGGDPRKSTLYFALYTVAPTDSGGGTEMTTDNWSNYARVAVTNNNTNFPSTSSRTKTNGTDISWGTASSSDDDVAVAVGLFDASSGGNLLMWDAIASITVQNGNTVKIPAGLASFSIEGLTDAYATSVLDYIVGGGSDPRKTTHYLAFYTVAPTASTSGTEASTSWWTDYARIAKTNNSTTWPNASGGSKSSGVAFDFGEVALTVSPTTVVAAGILDASTSGNLLWFGSLGSISMSNGNEISIPIGSATIALD